MNLEPASEAAAPDARLLEGNSTEGNSTEGNSRYWRVAEVEQTELLVDAEVYYASFCRAALLARSYIYLQGWQFDSLARLLRPAPGQQPDHPIELLPFLEYLCARTPKLQVFILAWDYSLVYALEREWLQKLKFEFQSHPRVHFEFSGHPGVGGCLHQKLAIVDDRVAFLGGLDVCDARWDTRAHLPADPARRDVRGKPYKAFHDIQVAVRGPIVKALTQLFCESWRRARSDQPVPSEPVGSEGALSESVPVQPDPDAEVESEPADRFDLRRLSSGRGLPLSATRLGVSLTDIIATTERPALEVLSLFQHAIRGAERLIYIETQYFTSRAVAEALCERFADATRGKLACILLMPDGADTPKEDLVLGARQRAVRHRVAQMAARHGHAFRLLKSRERRALEGQPATFIHSKLLIVDDELLSAGSANLTNRSMSLDTELNVSCAGVLERADDVERLRGEIARVRANLLAEHAGRADADYFLPVADLVERIDAACRDPQGKLQRQEIAEPERGNELLTALFDPARPLDWETVEQSLEGSRD